MATAVDDSYSAPSGATLRAGRYEALPAWLAGAVPGQWVAVPGGQPSAAAGLAPAVAGSMGYQSGMVNAWNGAFADGTRFMIHGGGHADYGGNEIGVIDLSSETPAWGLLVERTPVADLLGGSNYYADGRPTSRHTYYAMAVAEVGGVKRLLRFNGWMGFAYNGTPVGGSADVRTVAVDGFRLDTNAWEPGAFGNVTTITGSETSFAMDPTTGDCYAWHGANNTVQKWSAATQTCSQIADMSGTEGTGGACAFDAVNQRLIRFAGREGAKCVYCDVSTGAKVTPTLTGPDAGDISSLSGNNVGWGRALDTRRNVAWLMSNAGVLWKIRLSDFYVERVDASGEEPSYSTNGVWGKLQYLPDMDCIVHLANWTSPLLVMRCA